MTKGCGKKKDGIKLLAVKGEMILRNTAIWMLKSSSSMR